ncbi:hypothetical protein [Paenibacillus dakarensis]|uniref:hypothetical protein n=1 Tax=Paenibacillus dakarensis TaxID=1527293 RepID=UPI0006D558BA|nr:hypothetical protein [Paenibacillus dakarensis]
MERIYKVLRNITMFVIMFVISLALYLPVEDQYGNENVSGRSVHEPHKHVKIPVVKKNFHSLSKLAIVIVLFGLTGLTVLRIPKPHPPYHPTILLRLHLLFLSPIKYTSKFL